MRITEQQAKIIVEKTAEVLPDTKHILLFGSRVDDLLKGGDIDIYIETNSDIESPADVTSIITKKLNIALNEEKVCVLLFAPNVYELPIHRIAKETGVALK